MAAGSTFQCPRCGRCGSRGSGLPRLRMGKQVSMPSVRAVWLARPVQRKGRPPAAGFNALGAGGVARATMPSSASMPSTSRFQCPRCGRCGSRGRRADSPRRCGRVSMPSVRAVWLARTSGIERSRPPRRVSMPSVRAVWLARSLSINDSTVASRFQCPRCGRCGSRDFWFDLLSKAGGGFNALGAGGVARAEVISHLRQVENAVSMPSVRAVWLARGKYER